MSLRAALVGLIVVGTVGFVVGTTIERSSGAFGLILFAALFGLTARRGVTDPVCGMKVDRRKAIRKELAGETYFFCSKHCLHAFEADAGRFDRADKTDAVETRVVAHSIKGHQRL